MFSLFLPSSTGAQAAIALGCALAVSWLLTFLLLRCAPRLGLVDLPSARKVHVHPTPRGGGLAIYLGMVVTALLFSATLDRDIGAVLVLGLVIVVLGLVDDWRPLPWQLRIAVQGVVAAVAAYRLPAEFGWAVRIAAVFWIVGLVNAFNMLDNMDALSAGVAWIAALGLAAAVLLRQDGPWDWRPALPYVMLMGALAGFLAFNRPPARIFMGDAGSTFLGFFLGVRTLEGGLIDNSAPQTWAVPVCFLAVPWYDLVTVVSLRLWQGHSPFHADKQHLSHRLVQLGLSSPRAVAVIYCLAAASGAAGLVLLFVPAKAAALVGIEVSSMWLAVALVEYVRHFRAH